MADLRRLFVQNIFVGQSNTKTVDDLWTKYCEARQSYTNQLVRSQRLETEVCQLKAELTVGSHALQAERSTRESLQGSVYERDQHIAHLSDQLSVHENPSQNSVRRTVKFTEPVGKSSEAERVSVKADQQGKYCAHLERCLTQMEYEKAQQEERLRQCNGRIARRDQTIRDLQAFLQKSGLQPQM